MTLAELFPDEDYRFHFRFERGSIAEFFQPTAQHEKIIAQRRFWLETAPSNYAALLPEAILLLQESIALGLQEKTITAGPALNLATQASPWQRCLELGMAWEPDFL